MRVRTMVGIALVSAMACARGAAGYKPEPFKNEKEKSSYAFGVSIARQMKTRPMDLDRAAVVRGFEDALANGRTLLTDEEVRAAVAALQKDYSAKLAALKREQTRTRQAAAVASNPERPVQLLLSYKLDARLATGTYGGSDRWVSPQTFTKVGDASTCAVVVKVRGLDAGGAPTGVHPRWSASDPEMVAVSPGEGADVTLLVKRAGTSRVRVAADGVSKELAVRGEHKNGVLQVEITSTEVGGRP